MQNSYAKFNSNQGLLCSYAELAVFFAAVTIAIVCTHYAYIRKDGQAELLWVALLNTKFTIYPQTVTRLGANPARRRITWLMHSAILQLNQIAMLLLRDNVDRNEHTFRKKSYAGELLYPNSRDRADKMSESKWAKHNDIHIRQVSLGSMCCGGGHVAKDLSGSYEPLVDSNIADCGLKLNDET